MSIDTSYKYVSFGDYSALAVTVITTSPVASNLGLTISKIESEIKYVKSDVYYKTLIKKLERESLNSKTDAEENSKENELNSDKTKSTKKNTDKSKK